MAPAHHGHGLGSLGLNATFQATQPHTTHHNHHPFAVQSHHITHLQESCKFPFLLMVATKHTCIVVCCPRFFFSFFPFHLIPTSHAATWQGVRWHSKERGNNDVLCILYLMKPSSCVYVCVVWQSSCLAAAALWFFANLLARASCMASGD